MDFREVLTGGGEPLDIYDDIVPVLEDVCLLPWKVEEIYRKASSYDDAHLDRLRFALVRLQVYADIHRNEDMEKAQAIKYASVVLEKVIFGSLMLGHEEMERD
ncbi:MAG TPA: hypothetical protein PK445_07020 [Methanolinea sp.]|jgi:hypothetical protein|nr:hypothetical protein [Methanolinea sp.]HOS82460.1 hypothetical protein [Methanolinea sp.]HPC55718.1 hypothetical protein [Methanolinea sp.]HQE86000.1 hypothetical protein [Methanolinea sp.]HQI14829.1 hypothetical protein [Methanolinea sp.]